MSTAKLTEALTKFSRKIQQDANDIQSLIEICREDDDDCFVTDSSSAFNQQEYHNQTSIKFLSEQGRRIKHLQNITGDVDKSIDNYRKKTNKNQMPLTDLATNCRILHSQNAKLLLQLEETLRSNFGYVSPVGARKRRINREEEYYMVDEDGVEKNIYGEVMDFPTEENDEVTAKVVGEEGEQEYHHVSEGLDQGMESIVASFVGQPLKRLSEELLESDTSLIADALNDTPESLMSPTILKEQDSYCAEENEDSALGRKSFPSTPVTPSFASLGLSMTTQNVLSNDESSTMDADDENSTNKIDCNSRQLFDEYLPPQLEDEGNEVPHNKMQNEVATGDNGVIVNGCNNGPKAPANTFDNEEYVNLLNTTGDMTSLLDEGMSLASTVISERKSKVAAATQTIDPNVALSTVKVGDCSHSNVVQFTQESEQQVTETESRIIPIAELNMSTGCNEVDPKSTKVDILNICNPAQQDAEEAFVEDVEDIEESLGTTPVLDRFQVQVLNGGTECKVTPIEEDVLKSAESPIMKNKSPHESLSRDRDVCLDLFQVQVLNDGKECRVMPIKEEVSKHEDEFLSREKSKEDKAADDIETEEKDNIPSNGNIDSTASAKAIINFVSPLHAFSQGKKEFPKTPIPSNGKHNELKHKEELYTDKDEIEDKIKGDMPSKDVTCEDSTPIPFKSDCGGTRIENGFNIEHHSVKQPTNLIEDLTTSDFQVEKINTRSEDVNVRHSSTIENHAVNFTSPPLKASFGQGKQYAKTPMPLKIHNIEEEYDEKSNLKEEDVGNGNESSSLEQLQKENRNSDNKVEKKNGSNENIIDIDSATVEKHAVSFVSPTSTVALGQRRKYQKTPMPSKNSQIINEADDGSHTVKQEGGGLGNESLSPEHPCHNETTDDIDAKKKKMANKDVMDLDSTVAKNTTTRFVASHSNLSSVERKKYPKTPIPPKTEHDANEGSQSVHNSQNITTTPSESLQIKDAFARTPHAVAWISKHMTGEEKENYLNILSGERRRQQVTATSTEKMDKDEVSNDVVRKMDFDLNGEEKYESTSNVCKLNSTTNMQHKRQFIEYLQKVEYEAAPRVVKMQVSMEEINQATDTFNDWLNKQDIGNKQSISLMESDANKVMEQIFDKRKGKSVLMSFCHFRRMVIQLSSTETGKRFYIPFFE